eukprot:41614_1
MALTVKKWETSFACVLCNVLRHHSYRSYVCPSSDHINSIVESQQESQIETSLCARDLLRHDSPSSPTTHIPVAYASFENHHVRYLIHKCTRSNDVLSIINTYRDKIEIEAASFGKAMQKSNQLKDYSTTIQLMDILLLHTTVTPSIVEFNILFNGLCLARNHFEIIKYLEVMLQKYKIKPDLFTFCALFKTCRTTGRYDEAQKYWDLMRHKFNIEPNEIAYNELMLVYSKSNKKWRVIALFNEYLFKLKCNEMSLNVILFQTYLNIFCRLGDVAGMLEALELLTRYGIGYNGIIYLYVMRGYLVNRQMDKCIETFNELLHSRLPMDKSHFCLKCVALIHIMKHNINNYDVKLKLYGEIEDIIYHQFKDYGWSATQVEFRLLFQACIVLYHNVDPMQMVQTFEKLMNNGCIGFTNVCAHTGKLRVDLHGYQKSEAQFILRYLIGFVLNDKRKYEEWIHNDRGLNDYLVILTGKGRHSSGKSNLEANLREFMMEELMSYDPPIKSEIDARNTGQIKIHKSHLKAYCEDEGKSNGQMNYAMQRLTLASDDWWMDDFNERKKLRKANVVQYCYEYNKMKRHRDRNEMSLQKLNAMTCVFGEGKEIELYDENDAKWCRLIIKKHVANTQFILYDIESKIHKLINLKGLLQVS